MRDKGEPRSAAPYWNFRIIRRSTHSPFPEWRYEVYECWYDHGQAPGDIPDLWSAEPADVFGETVVALEWQLQRMLKATKLPVLVERGDHLEVAPAEHPEGKCDE
jgi:hypothetical protein